jgi:hypothetical protein
MATSPADLTTYAPASPSDVVVSPRRVVVGIIVVVGLLNIANAIAIAAGADTEHARYWLMALEWNPSSWFSSALLAVTAGAAFVVGRDGDGRRWNTVAALLLVMSIDEIATLHERMAALPVIPGVGSRGWAGAGLVLVALVAVRLVPWALTLDRALRRALIVGGAVFVAGAVGFEVLSGNRAEAVGEDGLFWVLATIEEDLEVLGVVLVLRALLSRLSTKGTAVRLRVAA